MPVSNSVIRRYTPPTCTLEVLAQSSALSQWMGKSVLKQLQFELRFDDPRLPEEKRIAIRGDSDQLETLCAVVTGYVQEFLEMSPESFWANFSGTNFPATEDVSVVSDETEQTNVYNPASQKIPTRNSFTHSPHADIKIKPSDHLTHNLFLGSLANPASGPVIQLSLLQLFDLATALDEYSADVVALPNLTPSSTRSGGIPAWAPVAAVLVIGVGLAPFTWQYANRVRQQQTAKKPISTEQKIALEASPSQGLSTSTAVPTLAPSSSLPSPPLPPFGSTLAVPNASPSIAQTLPSVPVTPQTTAKSTFPSIPQTSPSIGNVAKAPLPPLGNPLSISGTTKTPTFSTSPQNTAPKQQIALQPKLQPNFTALTPKSEPNSTSVQKNSAPNNLSSTNNTSSTSTGASLLRGTSSKDASRTRSVSERDTAVTPGGNPPMPYGQASPPTALAPQGTAPSNGLAPQDSAASSLATSPQSSTSTSREPVYSQPGSRPSGTDALISRLREARARRANLSTEVATNSTVRSGTLFDTPQVSEARDILKKRWQPPSGLRQSIEYSLSVGVDGTIEQILPMGKAARDYVDRTGMPLIGEPFVSPNKNGQSVKIRAIFSPDGKVQTFPETE
ncbi:DUF4335 domain-containing protein [Scytonema tolypothrichoides VB-61278]|nr:DUF4335 domain-containing protein [Scytonema tolypothrichoides VB-61278]